ncbi:STAS-like domain-containing protein [Desnuesiella massiliensis]|uniref:STAS-like domain-containing protein n=1 Tax=Desnuesiella massiliensis TaxID=1650662 RepID=UPI0006E2F1EB|nr:STAS-like domain-containing protein [Desnuesiella massiliensis]
MDIKVKEVLGTKFSDEDAIVLRNYIKANMDKELILDFSDINKVPTTFLCCLFTELIYTEGRDYIFSRINVKNLSNYRDYRRVVLGTAF